MTKMLKDKKRCLAYVFPEMVNEWNFVKNKALSPENVSWSSGKKVWWKCKKGHEWQAKICNRVSVNRSGCPYCANRKVCKDNCLATVNSELASEWHSTKNGKLTPNDVIYGSHKKVWWKCKKGHEWEANIVDRINGTNCPYCANKKVCRDNCLATVNSELASEWHPTKNGKLTPNNVTKGSHKIIWWKCKKGHEWRAKVNDRGSERARGCPYCANRKVCKDNCLSTLFPELVSEWHPTKNKGLMPKNVVPYSNKKVWWKCKKGHEWEAVIQNRSVNNQSCPYCANKKVCRDNCLDTLNPELASEWHPTKNGGYTPNDVTKGSNKKVWWKCKKGHEWRAVVSDRNRGKGCPSCFGVTLRDGTTCASFVEAYFYIKYKNDGIHFLHDKIYSKSLGGRRYDFYIPSQNKYIEVTSFDKNYTYYFSYLRNIVIKKRYVELELKGKFVFISKKLSMREISMVKNNMESK